MLYNLNLASDRGLQNVNKSEFLAQVLTLFMLMILVESNRVHNCLVASILEYERRGLGSDPARLNLFSRSCSTCTSRELGCKKSVGRRDGEGED